MQRFWNSLAALCAFLAATSIALTASATILTFNIDNVSPTGSPAGTATLLTTHANYGDNVSSTSALDGTFVNNYGIGNAFTPDIKVAYSVAGAATDQQYYTDGDAAVSPLWKDVNFIIGSGGALFRMTFTPDDPKYGVQVNSFDVFGYATSLSHTLSWTLRKDSPLGAIIASSGVLTTTTQTHASPLTIITGAPAYYGTVVLEINHLTGSGGAFGMDNLNFDQIPPVPEPSTLALLGLGLVGLVRHARRRKIAVGCNYRLSANR